MPLFSDVVVTFFSLNVVVSRNGQFFGCATIAFSERYNACIPACRKGLGASFVSHYITLGPPESLLFDFMSFCLSVSIQCSFFLNIQIMTVYSFFFTINVYFSICSVVFTFSFICLWLDLSTDNTVTF